jgi:hypothetical protein
MSSFTRVNLVKYIFFTYTFLNLGVINLHLAKKARENTVIVSRVLWTRRIFVIN